jgi:hypothetical protein
MREFDQRMGQVGAFREQVILAARTLEMARGQKVSASQAVNHILTLMGRTSGSHTGAAPIQPGVVASNKPVIPNIRARGGSPIKKVPTSIDELKAQTKARLAELNQ